MQNKARLELADYEAVSKRTVFGVTVSPLHTAAWFLCFALSQEAIFKNKNNQTVGSTFVSVNNLQQSFFFLITGELSTATESFRQEMGIHFYASRSTSKVSF